MCNVTSSDASLADDRAIKSYLFCSIARLNIWRIGISMLPCTNLCQDHSGFSGSYHVRSWPDFGGNSLLSFSLIVSRFMFRGRTAQEVTTDWQMYVPSPHACGHKAGGG